MPRLAEVIDAVVGIDTHRDVHVAELADTSGAPLGVVQIPNTDRGFAELVGWITRHRPGPRVAVSIEGTRSFGIGVARALSAAGLPVIECEQPARKTRRGRGKSDPIDAHLAVLAALQLDADRLPTPRADGTREALRILLGARQELTTTATAQTNRLRALLLSGPDRDRDLSRARLTDTTLAPWPAAVCPPMPPSNKPYGTTRSAASPLRCASRPDPQGQPAPAPGTGRQHRPRPHPPPGPGPGQRGPVIVSYSIPGASATKRRSPQWPAPARFRPAAAEPSATGSTAAETAPSTARSTPSRSPGNAAARAPAATPPDAPQKARHPVRSAAASSDTSPVSSTEHSPQP